VRFLRSADRLPDYVLPELRQAKLKAMSLGVVQVMAVSFLQSWFRIGA
jgi:hypothetical protein